MCIYIYIFMYVYIYIYIYIVVPRKYQDMLPVTVNNTLLSRELPPCHSSAETPLQPLIWCSESLLSYMCFSQIMFCSQTPVWNTNTLKTLQFDELGDCPLTGEIVSLNHKNMVGSNPHVLIRLQK